MTSIETLSVQESRRRAPTACSFCRRRKLKCSNEHPQCVNCQTFDQECIYAQPSKKKRSSYSRISHLEEENKSLRSRLESTSHSSKTTIPPRLPSPSQSPTRSNPAPNPSTAVSSSELVSSVPLPFGTSGDGSLMARGEQRSPHSGQTYHGLTSALVLDERSWMNTSSQGDITEPPSGNLVSKQLEEEAARQRQLEAFNFYHGTLDFDGVDPELGMHLLSLHWNRQHHSFLITYRPAFMRDMACKGPHFSKLLLNAICFGASKFSNRIEVRSDPADVRTAGWIYRQRTRELLSTALDRSEITTIQALLILTNSLFALGEERSAAWLYAGIACRMVIDLGIHVDVSSSPTHQFSSEDIEVRRRVFWAAFVVDKMQSLYQGRPANLQEVNCRVPLIFLDKDEEKKPWKPFGFSGVQPYSEVPTYSVSTFTELCKLCVIMNRILNNVYAEQSPNRGSNGLVEDQRHLHEELEQWQSKLPKHLHFHPSSSDQLVPPPHVISLLAMRYVLLIILHRPFVAHGNAYSTTLSRARESFETCSEAAKEIAELLEAYKRTFSIQKAPHLISYATYVAATIHVRVAAQKPPGSDAHLCLQACVAILNENKTTNPVVGSAMLTLQNLMSQMGVSCEGNHNLPDNRTSRNPFLISQHRSVDGSRKSPAVFGRLEESRKVTKPPFVGDTTHLAPTTSDFDFDSILQSFMESHGAERPSDGPTQEHDQCFALASVDECTQFHEEMSLDPANVGCVPTVDEYIRRYDMMNPPSGYRGRFPDTNLLDEYIM